MWKNLVEKLKWSVPLSFRCCSRRKAFNGAEEIARERQREERREQKQNGMRQIERPESRTKEGKINSEKRRSYEGLSEEHTACIRGFHICLEELLVHAMWCQLLVGQLMRTEKEQTSP